ncbi:RraA family protein [Alicyclobacillus tolerans]|uniref:RraA family protein n=1 Tax=Alicyclobacillus tolerans TaxID=90970 RepID=UPI001F46AE16|nr:RraA family protein [Alicyclobacillus tolerans]MCF8567458.1 RraA family protein [Alicyclobacillus tolerans]
MDNVGFRVLPAVRKVSEELIDQYRSFVTPHISDNMNRLNAVDASIRPIHQAGKLAGHAFTVKTRPGDNLMIHKAIDLAGPGDVIVVDGGGSVNNALIGEIMVRIAMKRGIEGFVIDGAVRDSTEIRDLNYPVYAKGITHRGPYKDGPGEINVPVQIGGVVVFPGDIVVGDMDGIAVVPSDQAVSLVEKIQTKRKSELETMREIENGTLDRSWVDETLRQKGCQGIEFRAN